MDTINSKEPTSGGPTFRNLGIAPNILRVLDALNLTTPTPIQHQAIPAAVEGKDVVGVAQTGTGKTLAFGIPTLQRLLSVRGQALILLPTRELALQVEESLRRVGAPLGIKTAVLIGGASMGPQMSALRRNPDIIIATPGRLMDHVEQRTAKLGGITMLVLDEADRMLDMGFLPQIKRILEVLPAERQTMLFSATLSHEIMNIATKWMKLPLRIEVAPQGSTAERVTQEFFVVKKEDKGRLLEKILEQYKGSTIVFTRTKHGASKVMRSIRSMGHTAAEIHGNRSLGQRREALDGFRNGKYRVLVATDIAARGIDVVGIELVINYDLPMQSADYVHRIGRTARAGAEGHAISFAEPQQKRDIREIETLIKKTVQVTPLPQLPPARAKAPEGDRPFAPRPSQRPFGGPARQGGFPPRREGGFPPRREGGFKPRRDFAPRTDGAPRTGGFSGPRKEGDKPFTPRPSFGSSAPRAGGFPPRKPFGARPGGKPSFGASSSRPPRVSGTKPWHRKGGSSGGSSGGRRFGGGSRPQSSN